jgi:hypothetical protein
MRTESGQEGGKCQEVVFDHDFDGIEFCRHLQKKTYFRFRLCKHLVHNWNREKVIMK